MGSRRVLVLLAVTGGFVAFVLVATGSLIAGTLAGLLVLGACLFAIRAGVPEDPAVVHVVLEGLDACRRATEWFDARGAQVLAGPLVGPG